MVHFVVVETDSVPSPAKSASEEREKHPSGTQESDAPKLEISYKGILQLHRTTLHDPENGSQVIFYLGITCSSPTDYPPSMMPHPQFISTISLKLHKLMKLHRNYAQVTPYRNAVMLLQ